MRLVVVLALSCAGLLAFGAASGTAAVSSSYPTTVFSDTFESGGTGAWSGAPGNGTVSVSAAAAHAGANGLNLTNAVGQYSVLVKNLTDPVVNSSSTFWLRVGTGGGIETVAQGRGPGSSGQMWELLYDPSNQRFFFYPFSASGSTEIATSANSAPLNTWIQVEIRYDANSSGGARIYINGATQPSWGVDGDYTRTQGGLGTLQLWNDAVNTTQFDDVRVGSAATAATAPGAPTNVAATAGNASATVTWTAPSSNGGSAITGYRITRYVNGTAVGTTSAGATATSATVSGLTNGTAYTFTVAAINAIGTSAESTASSAVTPRAAATVPTAVTGVTGTAGNGSVALSWSTPADDGGRTITSYRITPVIGGTAQTAIQTGSAATSYTVTGLTNGTAYTFRVAAVNSVGTGPDGTGGPFTPTSTGPTTPVFSDGFESGNLSNWNGTPGTGSVVVGAAGARSGTNGLSMTNAIGQYSLAVKSLSASVNDSATKFWVRVGSAAGVQTIAQARDAGGGARMWELLYDGTNQRLYFYPYTDAGSTEIVTPAGSVPINRWTEITVRYNATATGGAQLYINGQTQASWGFTGNTIRSTNLQTLQLWNDAVNTVSFDDVSVTSAPTAPMAPRSLTGATGDAWVSLSWQAPSDDGGRAITGYRITPYINGVAQAATLTNSTATDYNVTGLTNGTTYTFTVAAINSVGTGPQSAPTRTLTPRATASVPDAPTGLTGTAGERSVALSWTEPVEDGGRTITGYRITPYVGGVPQTPIDTGSSDTSYIAMGLTNGTAYTFRVAAVNAVGAGASSAATGTLTPTWTGPTDVVFSDGFESGTLGAWDGTPGTGLVAVDSKVAHTGGAGLSMSNGIGQYSLLVKALAQPAADSGVRFWVRIPAAGGTQTIAQARDQASSARMWDMMYDGSRGRLFLYAYRNSGNPLEIATADGALPLGKWAEVEVRYTATATGGARLYINGQTQNSWAVTGDFTRTTNLQRLQLWNDGTSVVDFDDVAILADPADRPGGTTVPDAPTAVTAQRGDGSATVSWKAPADDGGRSITSYTITPYLGGAPQTPIATGSPALSYTVSGLTNDSPYSFTVAATNSLGTGAASDLSATVTPRASTPPDPPTGVTATRGDGSASLDWTAPADNGGSAITGYRITPYIGPDAQTPILTGTTATSRTLNGLANGTTYTFTVAAINAIGTGNDSAASNAVTPNAPTAPSAPSSVTGTAGDTAVSLAWSAPADDGGSPITSYVITPYVGGSPRTPVDTDSSSLRYTVTGLTNGTAYTFRVAAVNALGTSVNSAASAAVTPVPNPPNPIVTENQKAGTTSWQFDENRKAESHEIEGYASAQSVNKGDAIDLKVSLSSSAQYDMDIYRMGWYPNGTNPDGTSCSPSCGGRLMQHVGPLNGARQATCPQVTSSTSPNYGMTECSWTTSYRLTVPTTWTSGNYIVKLTRRDGQRLENFMTFAVRDDTSNAKVIYGLDTSTWQAYNFWGGAGNNNVGISLYGRTNDVTQDEIAGSRAYTVSFDRPYAVQGATDGAGLFMVWDFPMVRWMESQGYDMTYVTSADLEADPQRLRGHKVFVNVGHDEYYSDGMMQTIRNGISAGTNLALFSANNFYYRSTWAPNVAGASLRRLHSDKGAQTGLATVEWRNVSPPVPENTISGVLLAGVANSRPLLVADANHWIYNGSGLKTYTGNGSSGVVTSGPNQNALPGIVGYEFDSRAGSNQALAPYQAYEPAGVTTLAHSFVPAADNGVNAWSDATVYTASSGAQVFAAGTIQWSFTVDNGFPDGYCDCGHSVANSAGQRVTKNIIDRLTQ